MRSLISKTRTRDEDRYDELDCSSDEETSDLAIPKDGRAHALKDRESPTDFLP